MTAERDRSGLTVVVAAYNEGDRVADTVRALHEVFPGARVIVTDDASTDSTVAEAQAAGAEVVTSSVNSGKGANATRGAQLALSAPQPPTVVLLADADLGDSARELARLVDAVEADSRALAVAVFARRVGGGFGLALGASRRAIRRATGIVPIAPISGQRAMSADCLRAVIPFAHGFGMETAMTIDAHRAGFKLTEIEVDLEHRATGKSVAGFAHRARQTIDIIRAGRSARRS